MPGFPADQPERARSDRPSAEDGFVQAGVVLGHDRRVFGGQELQEKLEVLFETDAHGMVIEHLQAAHGGAAPVQELLVALDALDLAELLRGLADQLLQGEDHVGRREGPAVVEADVPPQVEGIFAMIGGNRPALGQLGGEVAQVFGLDQVVEDELGELPVDVDVPFPRDQRPGLGKDECLHALRRHGALGRRAGRRGSSRPAPGRRRPAPVPAAGSFSRSASFSLRSAGSGLFPRR